jgi:hypothetical protein
MGKVGLIAVIVIQTYVLIFGSAAHAVSITYTSTPEYMGEPQPTGVTISVPFTCEMSYIEEMPSYTTTANYGAMISQTVLRFHTSDAYYVYGPYGSSDSWQGSVDYGNYAGLTLSGDTSGGSVSVSSTYPVTAVDYEELVYAISGYSVHISYGSLDAGTQLRILTSDAYHVYGPYGSSDSWQGPVEYDTYAMFTLSANTSGGSVTVSTSAPVSSIVVVPESTECPSADLSGDCFVDLDDLKLFAQQWCIGVETPCPTADFSGDCFIDLEDFVVIAQQWYSGN